METSSRTNIGILGDEDTINGFMISGVESNTKNPNLLLANYNTSEEDLKKMFNSLVFRKDLALILICDFVFEKIREEISKFNDDLPSIIEIPSKIKNVNL
ncbi:V-type proton ATPase subunit F (VATF) [Vairimorpha necatrix]|uniref:V-type proton ATPase subunit F (VATF) n=1 Tax=Vairimorpha necatrix TaxID=6039 RepID=A0AAX4JG60_9MICR